LRELTIDPERRLGILPAREMLDLGKAMEDVLSRTDEDHSMPQTKRDADLDVATAAALRFSSVLCKSQTDIRGA
jgi:hypothetical protein